MVELEALYGRGKDHADGPAHHADTTVVGKDTFVQWWMSYQRDLRRKLLTETMNMWDDHQKRSFKWDDAGDGLQKRSFNVVVGKATGLPSYQGFSIGKLDPPFDSSSTFALVPRANPDVIAREEFEEWWGTRSATMGPRSRSSQSTWREKSRLRRRPGEFHGVGSNRATGPSVLSENPYEKPEMGPRLWSTLCGLRRPETNKSSTRMSAQRGAAKRCGVF
jgi:hypothetical protein